MIKILFVCHGNICRSPMAEFVMKDMARQAGLGDQLEIASAATSTEEIGNPVHRGTQRILARHGISCAGKYARQMTRQDYRDYDLLIGMDDWNLRNMRRITGGDPEEKLFRLLDFSPAPREIADPWYTGDFETTYRDVKEGCSALLDCLRQKGLLTFPEK